MTSTAMHHDFQVISQAEHVPLARYASALIRGEGRRGPAP